MSSNTETTNLTPNHNNQFTSLLHNVDAEKAVVAHTIGQLTINADSQALPRTPPFTIPRLVETFVNRPTEMKALLQILLSAEKTKPIIAALQGGGGFGKTTLAQALCHHPRIRQRFPDGILWIELGPDPCLLDIIMNQIKLFDPNLPDSTDVNFASALFQDLLVYRRVLLVLDDVWHESHAKLFLPPHHNSASLLTTRRRDVSNWVRATAIDIGEMALSEAVTLLIKWLDTPPSEQSQFLQLADYLGKWPLLLELAGAYLRELVTLDGLSLSQAFDELWEALTIDGLIAFDRIDQGHHNKAISMSVEVSLTRLGNWRDRFVELTVFPQDVGIPFSTIRKLWHSTVQLRHQEAKRALRAMQRLSLFSRYEPSQQTVYLHSVIRKYLNQRHVEQMTTYHIQLLNAHRPSFMGYSPPNVFNLASKNHTKPNISWADMPADEPYMWDHLIYHLIESQQISELLTTIQDLRYLSAKIFYRNVSAVERDIAQVEAYLAQTDITDSLVNPALHNRLHRLQRILANTGQQFNHCNTLKGVMNTLYCQLYDLPELQTLVTHLKTGLKRPYFEPSHPLPNRPHPALRRTITGHHLAVTSCAYSPDSQYIVSGCLDYSLKIWHGETGLEKYTLTGHQGAVMACSYSPDGHYVISASWDKTVRLWDVDLGLMLVSYTGHTDRIHDCTFSPDGLYVVSASADNTLKVWDIDHNCCRFTLTGHTAAVNACVYSPDGQYIVSASDDGTLRVWQATTGTFLYTLVEYSEAILDCAYSPNQHYLASTSADHTITIWHGNTWQQLATFSGHTDVVAACTFSPDSHYLLTVSHDQTVKLWVVQTGEVYSTLRGHTDQVRACAYAPNGDYLVSAGYDTNLKVWDSLGDQISPASFKPTETMYACAYPRLKHNKQDQQVVAIAEGSDLKLWNVQTGKKLFTLTTHKKTIRDCVYSPDNRYIVTASWDHTLQMLDTRTGNCVRSLVGHQDMVESCTYSPNGHYILSSSADQSIKIWQADTGACLQTLTGHKAVVFSAHYSPDGNTILSASGDYTLKLWQANSGEVLHTFKGHTRSVNSCAFHPQGQLIVSASDDQTLRLWDTITGECIQRFEGHQHWVSHVQFSPNGRYILSSTVDGSLMLWETKTGEILANLMVNSSLYACSFGINGLDFVTVGSGGAYFLQIVE